MAPMVTGPSSSNQVSSPPPPSPSDPRVAADGSPDEAPRSQPTVAQPPAKPTPAAVIAGFPAPPSSLVGAPAYAVRVVLRQLELRTDLESLRRRRSPDVSLYEAALQAYEPRAFRLGMAITCVLLALLTIVFFMPVILRFARD